METFKLVKAIQITLIITLIIMIGVIFIVKLLNGKILNCLTKQDLILIAIIVFGVVLVITKSQMNKYKDI